MSPGGDGGQVVSLGEYWGLMEVYEGGSQNGVRNELMAG